MRISGLPVRSVRRDVPTAISRRETLMAALGSATNDNLSKDPSFGSKTATESKLRETCTASLFYRIFSRPVHRMASSPTAFPSNDITFPLESRGGDATGCPAYTTAQNEKKIKGILRLTGR